MSECGVKCKNIKKIQRKYSRIINRVQWEKIRSLVINTNELNFKKPFAWVVLGSS